MTIEELIKKRKDWIRVNKENNFNIMGILSGLYDKKTHFIYEIIQNAEDAKALEIEFNLFYNRIEIVHNGRNFNVKDIEGITGIGNSTKGKEDFNSIGKFGIGFKSVYTITDRPEIFSKDYSFSIDEFVVPIIYNKEKNTEKTLIRLNFKETEKDKIYNQLKNMLKELDLNTLLFLRNIVEIKYQIEGDKRGHYIKEEIEKNNITREISILSDTEKIDRWLVFNKKIELNEVELEEILNTKEEKEKFSKSNIFVQIGYKLDSKEYKCVEFEGSRLFVSFMTAKETHLKFAINGPFRTTPARDNIAKDLWNNKLIEIVGELTAESIEQIKEIKLLTADFLNLLPVNDKNFEGNENNFFKPIYERVKVMLKSEKEFLPTDKNGYVSSKNACLVRGKELKELLKKENIYEMFGKSDFEWIDENITEKKETFQLHSYLKKELDIIEITPEKFAEKITKEFLEKQTDEWIIKFYRFLNNQHSLWKIKKYYGEVEGTLRNKEIIRSENGKHYIFTSVVLPTENNLNGYFLTVKQKILENEECKEFILKLGIKEPNMRDYINSYILPKYEQIEINVSIDENIKDLTDIFKYSIPFKEHKIFLAKNIVTQEKKYMQYDKIYLGEIYSKSKSIEIFYEGINGIWLLDESYKKTDIENRIMELGIKRSISACDVKIDWIQIVNQNISLSSPEKLKYQKPKKEFKNIKIEHLNEVLKKINFQKALIIWNIISYGYLNCIKGEVRFSSNAQFPEYAVEEREIYSELGWELINKSWIPDKKGIFHKPGELFLSDLPDEFYKEDVYEIVSEKLGMKKSIYQELLEKLSEKEQEKIILAQNISDEELELLKQYREKKEKENKAKEVTYEEFTGLWNIENDKEKNIKNNNYIEKTSKISDEEEDAIFKNFGANMSDRLEKISSYKKSILSTKHLLIDSIDSKEFLLNEYNGRCQVCNIKLKTIKPYFEVFRIIETQGKVKYSGMEFNVISLCPNCHVEMKQNINQNSLKNSIIKAGKLWLKKDIAPEFVEERNGDYYIIVFKLNNDEKYIYYTQNHFSKIASFINSLK